MTAELPVMDVETVRAFVLIAELGSFTRAADVLDTTQAAISLKLKRLEERIGCRLLERTPRHVRLSQHGERFLEPARELLAAHERAVASIGAEPPRRLLLGISDHVAGSELPELIAKLAKHDPRLLIEVRIAASRDLVASFDRGEIEAVVVRREDNRKDGQKLFVDRFAWFAAPTFRYQIGEPLRIATLAAPCGVRAIAARVLDDAKIAWSEVFVGGGVLAVGAAVSAGLGVAALARRVAPSGAIDVGSSFGLPALPSSEVRLYSRLRDPRARDALRIVMSAFR
jgi:DNA-binding transcriptional LysR family regulator